MRASIRRVCESRELFTYCDSSLPARADASSIHPFETLPASIHQAESPSRSELTLPGRYACRDSSPPGRGSTRTFIPRLRVRHPIHPFQGKVALTIRAAPRLPWTLLQPGSSVPAICGQHRSAGLHPLGPASSSETLVKIRGSGPRETGRPATRRGAAQSHTGREVPSYGIEA